MDYNDFWSWENAKKLYIIVALFTWLFMGALAW